MWPVLRFSYGLRSCLAHPADLGRPGLVIDSTALGFECAEPADRCMARPAGASAPRSSSARGSILGTAGIIVAYVVLGLIAFWPVLPGTSNRLFGTSPDSVLAMWYLAWVPHSLHAGINPLFSHSIFAPGGVNLAQNTESPFLGLLTTPLALFAGPVARANTIMVLAMPVSATAALVVLRRWRVWLPGAGIGGLIYGFSPYAMGQSLGHLVLVFTPIVPFIALTMVSILQRRGPPVRLGIQLGLLVTVQFLAEPEIAVSVVIVSAWAVLCVALLFDKEIAARLWPCTKSILVAAGVAGTLLAYPVWMMTSGPEHYSGPGPRANNPYFNDLLSFLVPGPLQRNTLGLSHVAAHINAMTNSSEADGYIGFALVAIAIGLFVYSRKSPRMRLAAAIMAGALVLSLGSHLKVSGTSTAIPLPFLIVSHIPLIDNVLASRFALTVDACLAAIIAFGLDDIRRASARRPNRVSSARVATALCVITLVGLVATQLPRWPFASQAVDPLPTSIRNAIPHREPVAITYPYATPVYPEAMLWQVDAGYAFRLTGGYSMHATPSGAPTGYPNPLIPTGFENFLYGQEGFNTFISRRPITPQLIADARATLAHYHVRLIIVDRSVGGSVAVVQLLRSMLGPPSTTSGSLSAWVSHDKPL